MSVTTVADVGWSIAERVRDDGGVNLIAYIGHEPVWAASELLAPVGGYGWQIFHLSLTEQQLPAALVRDVDAARKWMEHEAQHALLVTKAVAL